MRFYGKKQLQFGYNRMSKKIQKMTSFLHVQEGGFLMEKTVNYNLNKPEPKDPLRVEDFNENSDAIDAALGALNERVYFGSWVGDGTKSRVIQLPFEPRFVLVMGHYYNSPTLYSAMNVLTQDRQYSINNYGCGSGSVDSGGLLEGDTITLGTLDLWNNRSGETVYYFAIK